MKEAAIFIHENGQLGLKPIFKDRLDFECHREGKGWARRVWALSAVLIQLPATRPSGSIGAPARSYNVFVTDRPTCPTLIYRGALAHL